jgi:saccharopine dehydrogenase-like NADP-dependent oxidoreductase
MGSDTKVAILGAGQIGRAVYEIISYLKRQATMMPNGSVYGNVETFVIDSSDANIFRLSGGSHLVVDLANSPMDELVKVLVDQKVTHVINALPFFLNEKAASAAAAAKCSYIDFTEDDVMADKVQAIYEGLNLNCAVKCGLAPGFINYIGYNLIGKIDTPDSLMISVGALPRTVSYDAAHPEHSYNLTWSVDGLVNEYIRPCRIRKDGVEKEVPALGGLCKVVLDGLEYEAAYTSGGVGSLVRDLKQVPNVHYMTLRYPGHYRYVRSVVQDNHAKFEPIKDIFLKNFPYTDDDVIVVYATASGKDQNGTLIRRNYFNRFYGINGLTGIQSTTASSGVAMLELMLYGKVKGIVNHTDVDLKDFTKTIAFENYYNTRK